jgi:ribonuclease VapC
MSAATYLEAGIVIDARMLGAFDRFVTNLDIDVIPVDLHQAGIARQAYRRFGKGSGHRAGLNFGDCFAYAAAIALDDTLLFKGTDFTYTDVRAAIE